MKGLRGENFMSSLLEQNLPNDWFIIDDLRIRSAQSPSGYSQIDHVVVAPKAVYCLETKNWRGKNYRTEDGWITKYKHEHGIYEFKKDPIPQVQGHAAAVKDALKQLHYDVPVIPVVVFTNSEFEYLSDPPEIPVICSEYLVNALLEHSLKPVVQDPIVLASKLLALHKDSRQGK
jgi:hypothetical protein